MGSFVRLQRGLACAVLCVLTTPGTVPARAHHAGAHHAGAHHAGAHHASARRALWHPRPGTRWQIQFTGSPRLHVHATAFDFDGFDTPESIVRTLHRRHRKAICYVDAGTWEDWRPDASQYPPEIKGNSNGWPGEVWLDIRRLDVIAPILRARVVMCKRKGFDAVEFDNVDGYLNDSGFPLSATDQLTFNRFLARAAHARGLSAGLKNDLAQIPSLEPSFEFAINESCFDYDECDLLLPFIKAHKAVFQIQYDRAPSEFCPRAREMGMSSIKKHENLDAYRIVC